MCNREQVAGMRGAYSLDMKEGVAAVRGCSATPWALARPAMGFVACAARSNGPALMGGIKWTRSTTEAYT